MIFRYSCVTRLNRPLVLAIALLSVPAPSLKGEDILFIGNSFTFGGNIPEMKIIKGIPTMVKLIAESKQKQATTEMLVAGGKDLGFHLEQPATLPKLASKNWNHVVIQDFTSKALLPGSLDEFFKNGAIFYHHIRAQAPGAQVVIYHTWARGKGSPLYNHPSGPVEDFAVLNKNFREQVARLEAIEPGVQVIHVPVGEAFRLVCEKHPEISLYDEDDKHPGMNGCYFSAPVFYGVLFHDSPVGATHDFLGVIVPPEDPKVLQATAVEALDSIRLQQ